MMQRKIMLIDDDPIFRDAAVALIKAEGLSQNIIQYENGVEAYDTLISLAQTPKELPDLVLLDIYMPVMNGWEFLEELRLAPRDVRQHIKIYILTSSIMPQDKTLSKSYPFIKGYLTKPLTRAKIQKLKRELIIHN
ncbi:MAG: response regulator transcription factor [Croceitalea sp.]|nr:response regulator transcription factor [Croceitalea sp.]